MTTDPRIDHKVDHLSFVLGGIEKQLETITKTLAEDRVADAQYRTDTRREIKEIDSKVEDLQNKVQSNDAKLSNLEPIVITLKEQALKRHGITDFANTLGRAMNFFSAGVGAILAILFSKWFTGNTTH